MSVSGDGRRVADPGAFSGPTRPERVRMRDFVASSVMRSRTGSDPLSGGTGADTGGPNGGEGWSRRLGVRVGRVPSGGIRGRRAGVAPGLAIETPLLGHLGFEVLVVGDRMGKSNTAFAAVCGGRL